MMSSVVPPSAGSKGGAHHRWSFSDVIRKMYDEERTGVLDVSGADGEWEIHLRHGHVVNIVVRQGVRWLLGEVLVASGVLRLSQLMRAQKDAKKRHVRVEDVLVSSGIVSQEVLARYEELQIRETILPLFRKVGVTCRLRHDAPMPSLTGNGLPLSVLLREAGRRVEAWPILERRVASMHAVFQKAAGTSTQVLAGSGAGVEERHGYEPGGAARDLEKWLNGGEKLTANERIVYFHVNGSKTGEQLAMASALGDFETVLSLYRLLGRGLVVLVDSAGAGEVVVERTVLPLLFRVAFYVVLAVAFFSIVTWRDAQWVVQAIDESPIPVSASVRESQLRRIRTALETFRLERGAYPETVAELNSAGFIGPSGVDPVRWGATPKYRASAR